MNLRAVASLSGQLLLGFSLTFLLPVAWAVGYGEWGSLRSFAITSALCAALGAAARGWAGGSHKLHRREALVVVALTWLCIPLLGSIPFLLDGVFTSPVDAIFESVSGFTTTGATVLTEIEAAMSRSMHWWRIEMHWLGGMGIIVLFIAVLPSMGAGGKMLFRSEVPGPITDGLKPRIREASAALWQIYIALTLTQTAALMILGGLDLWNASAHAMSTVATGGFSTMNASVGGFDSAWVDWITSLFMFLGGVNFSLYFLGYQGRWSAALQDREFRVYLFIVLLTCLVVTLCILPRHDGSLLRALRYGMFQTLAVITTTGFGTDDLDAYPNLARTLLFSLMFVGGCAGSTSGGVKIFRYVVMAKAAKIQLQRTFRPQVVVPLKVRGVAIDDDVVRGIFTFFIAFLFIFAIGSVLMSTMTPDLETAMSATIACLGSVGPGLAEVGPTKSYAFLPDAAKLLLSSLMVFGRLELFTLLLLLTPSFWQR